MARVNWVVVAQHALHDQQGCLHICGIIDTLSGLSQPPIRVPLFVLCFGVNGAPLSTITYALTATAPGGKRITLRTLPI